MKSQLKLSFGSFLLILLFSCEQPTKNKQEEMFQPYENAVFYEIFVQSFADSNGDGIGDIPGMTAKLDYLDDLGVDVIWLMPISPSPSYHKYDVTDYSGIHPDYGSMDDFKTFVKQAHDRGIRVIMDFVINHSSSEHPWFLDSKSGKNTKYRDYYVWADRDSIAKEIAKKETSFDSDNIRQWHPVEENDTISEHYYGFFYGGMPDFNFDNPEVRNEFYEIGRFWLSEANVDGFRLDAAKHIYPDDRAKDSQDFWKEFKSEMQQVKPDVYLIGEVWSDAKHASPYAAGFTSLFNFDRAFSILESINAEKQTVARIVGHSHQVSTKIHMADVINESLPWFKNYNSNFIEASFLSNHDQNRVASVLEGEEDKIKLSAVILFSLPGTPYIYYGEELGMLGMKPDEYIREPFLWRDKPNDNYRTKWITSKYSNDSTISSAADQIKDGNSIYSLYKELIQLKKSDLFSKGTIQKIETKNEHILAYSRHYEDETAMVYHNLSGSKLGVEKIEGQSQVIFRNGKLELLNGHVTLKPRASIILKRKILN